MIYIWDNHHRNETFRLCINTLNKVKGTNVEFNFCEADAKTLSVWIVYQGKNFKRTFYWEDLARATKKAFNEEINFEKLTDIQYLNLCKYITKDMWEIVRML